MDGDFKGDFSRDSFNVLQVFSRVLMQQGRVQLDADWNEQTDSLLYYLRTLAMNVIGPVGGRGNSFAIGQIQNESNKSVSAQNFTIGTGHYYVDGILCANDAVDDNDDLVPLKYTDQPYNPFYQNLSTLEEGQFLVYLDVWEREVTALEDDSIREVALGPGGPDTATRGQIVWQVRVIKATDVVDQPILGRITAPSNLILDDLLNIKKALTEQLQSNSRGRLIASTDDNPNTPPDPCLISPDAEFRGEENQLYRVEIHTGGTPVTQSQNEPGGRRKKAQQQESTPDGPTFKWSRENGSVVFVVLDDQIPSLTDGTITLSVANLGRDNSRFTLTKNDWVELFTPSSSLKQAPGQMLQVSKVDYTLMQVVLTFPKGTTTSSIPEPPFLLRRWDHHGGGGLTIAKDGAAKIIEDTLLNLENGIYITFKRPSPPAGATDQPDAYRTGDYWLIPARTATGTILWPNGSNGLLPPKGVIHHYAPLALITLASDRTIDANSTITDLRCKFEWLIERNS